LVPRGYASLSEVLSILHEDTVSDAAWQEDTGICPSSSAALRRWTSTVRLLRLC